MTAGKTVTLADVATIHGGGRLRLTGKDFVTEGFPAYGAGGMNGLLPVAEYHRPGLLLSTVGTCGRCYFASGHWTSLANTQVILPDPSKVDARYLWFQLNDEARWPKSGTSQPFIKPSDVKAHRVWLPPLEEQRRIAAILDQADALRAKRRASLARLAEFHSSLFLERFGDPVTNPMDWPVRAVGDFGRVTTGNTPPRANASLYGGDIEWIKSDNIVEGRTVVTEARERLSVEGRRVARLAPAGSLLTTCIAGSLRSIGTVAIANREVAFNQQINALTPAAEDLWFLYVQLWVGKRLVQEKSTGGMKGLVSKSQFISVPLIAPPRRVRDEYTRQALAAEALRDRATEQSERVEGLFGSLQDRAFKGEL